VKSATGPSKWMFELDPGAPAGECARRVFESRFDTVSAALDAAIRDGGDAPDLLRRLRVATRRGVAALDAFRDTIDGDGRRAMRKRLRKLRREAGHVRETDVFGAALLKRESEAPKAERAAIRFCVERAEHKRSKRYTEFRRSAGKHARKIRSSLEDVNASLDDAPAGHSAREAAREAFVHHGERLGAIAAQEKLADPHALRLELKRLKYTLEIFVACAEDREALLESHRRLADAQDMLGRLNDVEELAAWVERNASEAPDSDALSRGLATLASTLRSEAGDLREETLVWWSEREGRRFVATVARCLAGAVGAPADGAKVR